MPTPPAGLEPPLPAPPRSIHYRRRWAYVLWVSLLLLSLGALVLWERPLAVVSASFQLKVAIRQAPAGATVQAWAGPWAAWDGPGRFAGAPIQVQLGADGSATLPVFHLPIARRRWAGGYIPSGTWDLMMLRFTAPGEPDRYWVVPLSRDIRMGILRPRFRLISTLSTRWGLLEAQPQVPKTRP